MTRSIIETKISVLHTNQPKSRKYENILIITTDHPDMYLFVDLDVDDDDEVHLYIKLQREVVTKSTFYTLPYEPAKKS
jgi:hypothetical protein